MTTKTCALSAHVARNAAARAASIDARIERFLAHVERNNQASIEAAQRRADRIRAHAARNEEAALVAATLAYAEAVEARCGIGANDNAAIARAA